MFRAGESLRSREFIGEALGSFMLVFAGCGAVASSVLFDALQGLFQVALAWGAGVALAIYMTRQLSCAHLNPAVSLAMALAGRMDARKLPVYVAGQLFGAVAAGLALYALLSPSIASYEAAHGIVRGAPESARTAMVFGEFYPPPGGRASVGLATAMASEALGAFLLVLAVFCLTDGCNLGRPGSSAAPVFIGLTVSLLICLFAPLTQAGLNPARDFGPRLVACLAGWGGAAFPDRCGGFILVYVASPLAGGALASLFFSKVLAPAMSSRGEGGCCESSGG